MSTKSFQTEFKFSNKSGGALLNAIENSRRVDIEIKKPVNHYSELNKDKMHRKFDALFNRKEQN